jgi:hypothetical protein
MIIVNLKGGLGNQLFQYAVGRRMSIKNGDLLKLETSTYTAGNFRSYGLHNFNIVENIATGEEVAALKCPHGMISTFVRLFKAHILKQRNVTFDPRIFKMKGDIYLDGYWQSESYFCDIADTIRKDFSLRRPMTNDGERMHAAIKKNPTAVSVHIRRGDYLQKKANSYHGLCSTEYYVKAMEVLDRALHQGPGSNVHFFVFSDDIQWVKENIHFPHPVTFVSNASIPDYEELTLMSKCSHHIIANSSFSWWGAWLNPDPQKLVIAPQKWFNTKESKYKGIIPDTWTRI